MNDTSYDQGIISVDLYCADFRDVLPELKTGSIGACITDPPYPKKYQHLYFDLSRELPRVLRRNGSFLAIVPHYSMPDILSGVGEYMKYRWVISMWQEDGPHPRMAMGIEVLWKPIVWWVNEAWAQKQGFVTDGFKNEPPDKRDHEWQQSLTWAQNMLKYVPDRSGTILDPMLGAGTAGIAALQGGHDFIGIEINKESFDRARDNILNYTEKQDFDCDISIYGY